MIFKTTKHREKAVIIMTGDLVKKRTEKETLKLWEPDHVEMMIVRMANGNVASVKMDLP
jgi:hypothetical protein